MKQSKDDKTIKELLNGTKLKADDNLKYRIMQQIETEKVFYKKKETNTSPGLSTMFALFGIMYLVIALVGGGIYMTKGSEALMSTEFLMPVLLITSICSIFLMITELDERRKSKRKI